jgi:hypothetical protein
VWWIEGGKMLFDDKKTVIQSGDTMLFRLDNGTVSFCRTPEVAGNQMYFEGRGAQFFLPFVRTQNDAYTIAMFVASMHGLTVEPLRNDGKILVFKLV